VVEFPEKGHRVRHASSTFYIGRSVPEEATHVSEGWLYKKGKIVRSWKLRWFILDTEKGDVSEVKFESFWWNQINYCKFIVMMQELEYYDKLASSSGSPMIFGPSLNYKYHTNSYLC
jgi:hypothetical protein